MAASLTMVFAIAPALAQTTTPTQSPPPTPLPVEGCYRNTNYAHVAAGRAHQSLGRAYANGSNQNMGYYNVFVITSLRRLSPNYYVVTASCP